MDRELRILDANLNRAREGLRTAEEYARLGLNDAAAAQKLKDARRSVEACVMALGALNDRLLAARDVGGDVGLRPDAGDVQRTDAQAIARAALKRSQEALRVVEEFCQLYSREAASHAAKARYATYEAEQLVFAANPRAAISRHAVMCVFSAAAARDDWRDILGGLLQAGARLFQLREKDMPARNLAAHAEAFLAIVRPHGGLVVINDRADVAAGVGADGVHLGQRDLPLKQARRMLGPRAVIGASSHDLAEALDARDEGADYVGFGSMFPTTTKSIQSMATPAGLAEVVKAADIPVFPIGGIAPENVAQVAAAGARHVAVSGALLNAKDPGAAFKALQEALRPEPKQP